jgi:hypothetical protein
MATSAILKCDVATVAHHLRTDQREALDCHAFTSNRREECAQMPGKMARSAPRPPFGLPDALVAVLTSRLSCRKAGKARIFAPVREPSGESRLNPSRSLRHQRALTTLIVSILSSRRVRPSLNDGAVGIV